MVRAGVGLTATSPHPSAFAAAQPDTLPALGEGKLFALAFSFTSPLRGGRKLKRSANFRVGAPMFIFLIDL